MFYSFDIHILTIKDCYVQFKLPFPGPLPEGVHSDKLRSGKLLDNPPAHKVYSFVVHIIVTNNHCYQQWIANNKRKV